MLPDDAFVHSLENLVLHLPAFQVGSHSWYLELKDLGEEVTDCASVVVLGIIFQQHQLALDCLVVADVKGFVHRRETVKVLEERHCCQALAIRSPHLRIENHQLLDVFKDVMKYCVSLRENVECKFFDLLARHLRDIESILSLAKKHLRDLPVKVRKAHVYLDVVAQMTLRHIHREQLIEEIFR